MKKAVIVLGVILGLLGIVFLWLGNNVNELVKNATNIRNQAYNSFFK